MSEPTTCSDCGQGYGASWGDVTGLCSDCKNGITKESLKSENYELRQKIEKLQIILQKTNPNFTGENI